MIIEIAQIEVLPGMEEFFENGARQARDLFLRAEGCHGAALHRSFEKPQRYRLMVQWETVEHHTVMFRGSAAFQTWRDLVSAFFESPPTVEHVSQVI